MDNYTIAEYADSIIYFANKLKRAAEEERLVFSEGDNESTRTDIRKALTDLDDSMQSLSDYYAPEA